MRVQQREKAVAATKIQTVVRKHNAANQLAALRQAAEQAAATKIQTVARKHNAANQLAALRQAAVAATKIQTVVRKHNAANQLAALRQAAEAVKQKVEAEEAAKHRAEEQLVAAQREAEAAKHRAEEQLVAAQREAEAAKHRAEEQLVAVQREAEAAKHRAEEQLVAVQREAEAQRRAEEQLVAVQREAEAAQRRAEEQLVAVQREAEAAQRRAEEQLVAVQREAEAAQRRAEEQLVVAQRRVEGHTIGAFGAMEWEKYFGAVEPAPALPSDIGTILDSACPFWPDKKVKDTHLLVLMPKTVNGAPFTLNLLEELIQRPKNGGHRTEYRYYGNDTKAQFGAVPPDRSYWLLMTRDVLEGSRNKKYSDQSALVARHARRTGQPYEVPRALEAATAILMHHARTGERLFSDRPRTYTRCQELEDGKYPVIVGGFESSGLNVDFDDFRDYYVYINRGVAGCRKF